MSILTKTAGAFLLSMIAFQVYAVDLDAGDYDVAPTGTNLALLYLQHATRDSQYLGSNKVNNHIGLTSDIGIARYVHYTDVAGYRIAPQILVPFGRLKGEDDLSALGSTSGIGDVILATSIWFVNDQANKTYFGVTPYLFLPTGKYSNNDELNIGENRYKLNVQAAFSTRLAPKIAWDAAADFTVYGKNDDAIGGATLKQDVGYQLQSSVRYFLNERIDLRSGISYADAGDTKLNGISSASNKQTKFWLGTGFSPTATTNVILTYGRDMDVENGFKEDNRINVRLLKVF